MREFDRLTRKKHGQPNTGFRDPDEDHHHTFEALAVEIKKLVPNVDGRKSKSIKGHSQDS